MPSKISTIKRLRVLGDFMMFGIFICLLIIFLSAYINGVFHGEYKTLVDINSKNEAHVEFFILIVVLLPIFIMTTIWSFLDWKATWRARDSIRFSQYFFEPEIPEKKLDTILMKCSACRDVFGVTAIENEMKIECPHCGKSGHVKMPQKPRGPFRDRPEEFGRGHTDRPDRRTGRPTGDEPYVRIIKDIKNN